MTENHPITPPTELVDKWNKLPLSTQEILVIAAQWGADQELEACCEWLSKLPQQGEWFASALRNIRRPKPSSLKEQALAIIEQNETKSWATSSEDWAVIRRALKETSK